jgi:hypothetical protein
MSLHLPIHFSCYRNIDNSKRYRKGAHARHVTGKSQAPDGLWASPIEAPCLPDLRFCRLVGADAWARLPPAVQVRFAKRMQPGHSVTYEGDIVHCRLAPAGWLLAQLCRCIGSPLPLSDDIGVAAIATVTEDGVGGGQVWSRMYARHNGFPQVIHSAKRFAGPTGLEEYLGGGFGIALTVCADATGIAFLSDHYFLRLGPWRLRLPDWLSPGALRIDHQDAGGGRFAFTLSLHHAVLGELIHQVGRFRDRPTLN